MTRADNRNWEIEIRKPKLETRELPSLLRRGLRGGGFVLLYALTLLAAHTATAQVIIGTPPFGSFAGGPFDTINLSNLNVHFSIPILSKAGVGIPFNYALTYDNSIWYPSGAAGSRV
jgi:hypothetical protein